MKCKLLDIKDLDGRKVAEVRITGQVVKHDQGFIVTTTDLSGTSQIDLVNGQTLGADITGKMSSHGSEQRTGNDGQPVNVVVDADGQIDMHQTVRLLEGA